MLLVQASPPEESQCCVREQDILSTAKYCFKPMLQNNVGLDVKPQNKQSTPYTPRLIKTSDFWSL